MRLAPIHYLWYGAVFSGFYPIHYPLCLNTSGMQTPLPLNPLFCKLWAYMHLYLLSSQISFQWTFVKSQYLQRDGCWWPGACLAPGHRQQPWWQIPSFKWLINVLFFVTHKGFYAIFYHFVWICINLVKPCLIHVESVPSCFGGLGMASGPLETSGPDFKFNLKNSHLRMADPAAA